MRHTFKENFLDIWDDFSQYFIILSITIDNNIMIMIINVTIVII